MGHKYEDTAQYYVSGFIGIDSQSIIHEREQCLDLYKESSSMMANRNLLAPKPPESILTEPPHEIATQKLKEKGEENTEVVSTIQLSARQEQKFRRQLREKAYWKGRCEYLEGKGKAVRATATISTVPSREPSRYLLALLKFEPERKAVLDLMFRNDEATDKLAAVTSLAEVLEPLISLARSQRKRYAYKDAEPTKQNCCGDCGKVLTTYVCLCFMQLLLMFIRLRLDRAHRHLLQCARQRRVKKERAHMTAQFSLIHTCLWNDCYYRFDNKTCGSYSLHVTNHLQQSGSHQCLCDGCYKMFDSYEDLAYHVSEKHRVPNEWTTLTKMHYCYEHDVWCRSDQMWNTHLQAERRRFYVA